MPVLFQLFSADDLQLLGPAELITLRKFIKEVAERPPSVPEEIKQRAYEVFRQLTSPTTPINPPNPPTPGLPIIDQLFSANDLAQLDMQQRYILDMAIACEVLYSFRSLEAIKQRADAKFRDLTRSMAAFNRVPQNPQGPDSDYAPFNPASHLHGKYAVP